MEIENARPLLTSRLYPTEIQDGRRGRSAMKMYVCMHVRDSWIQPRVYKDNNNNSGSRDKAVVNAVKSWMSFFFCFKAIPCMRRMAGVTLYR